MNRFFLLLTLFIGLTLSETLLEYHTNGELDIIDDSNPNQPQIPVYTVPTPLMIPPYLKDYVTVTSTSRTSVIVCIQEALQLVNGLSSCNPDGYLNFTIINGTATPSFVEDFEQGTGGSKFSSPTSNFYDWPEKSVSIVTPLRLATTYYISFSFVWYGPDSVNTSAFSITVDANVCPEETLWGPDCQSQEKYPLLQINEPRDDKCPTGSYVYYYLQLAGLPNDQQYGGLTVTLDRADNGNNTIPIGLYYKRNAFPLFDRDPNTWDAFLFNQSTYELLVVSPPRVSNYLIFAVENQNAAEFAYTIEVTVQACEVGSVGKNCSYSLHEVSLLNVTVDNNLVNESWTGKLENDGFSYFHFSSPDQLIVGVGGEKEGETPNVYLGVNSVPSPTNYLLANENQTEEVHLLSADRKSVV